MDKIIDSIEIGNTYEIIGIDFVIIIKPTNISSSLSSTHVNFNSCEEIIRKDYNISKYSYITFLQMEINNTFNQSFIILLFAVMISNYILYNEYFKRHKETIFDWYDSYG
mgnify:CR=1 FL=1